MAMIDAEGVSVVLSITSESSVSEEEHRQESNIIISVLSDQALRVV